MDVEFGRGHRPVAYPPYRRGTSSVRPHHYHQAPPTISSAPTRSSWQDRTTSGCIGYHWSRFLSLDDKCLVVAYVLVAVLCCLFFVLLAAALYATALFLSLPGVDFDPNKGEELLDSTTSAAFDASLRLPQLGGKGFLVVGAPHSSLFVDDSDGLVHTFHGISYVLRRWVRHDDAGTAAPRDDDAGDAQRSRQQQEEEIERHMEAVAGLGLNLVRLGVRWADYEPRPGHYDSTYKRLLRHAVDAAARRGLRVLLYSHQARASPAPQAVLLSAKLCGEGFPDWAVLPSVSGDDVRKMGKTFEDYLDRLDQLRSGLYGGDDDEDLDVEDLYEGVDGANGDEDPSDEDQDIGMVLPANCPSWLAPSYYFTPEVASAFQNFYTGQHGTMKQYGAWWADIAAHLKEDTTVIGYQLLSQAFIGNYYHSPSLLHPGENDARNLAAVYAFLTSKIRRVDANHLIFFSDTYAMPLSMSLSHAATYSSVASRDSLVTHTNSGFTRLPSAVFGGQRRGDAARVGVEGKEVLAFSYECWYFDQLDPFPVPAYQETCNVFKGEDLLGYRKRDAKRLGSGLFVQGLGGYNSPHQEHSIEYLLEEANTGSLSWSYGLDHDDDEVLQMLDAAPTNQTRTQHPAQDDEFTSTVMKLRRLLSRPYARMLAGVPRSTMFNPHTRHFTLTFYPYAYDGGPEAKPPGVTEIYLHEDLHYPNGYKVSVFPSLLIHTSPQRHILHLSLKTQRNQGWFDPGEVMITITPK